MPRLNFVRHAEAVLREFAELVEDARAIEPPVNSSLLLDVELGLSESPNKNNALAAGFGSVKTNNKINNRNNQNNNKAAGQRQKRVGLLQSFLSFMDDAATDFSHLEYESAQMSLNNARMRVPMLRKRLDDILESRSGSLHCQAPVQVDGVGRTGNVVGTQGPEIWASFAFGASSGSNTHTRPGASGAGVEDGDRDISTAAAASSFWYYIRTVVQLLLLVSAAVAGAIYGRDSKLKQEERKRFGL